MDYKVIVVAFMCLWMTEVCGQKPDTQKACDTQIIYAQKLEPPYQYYYAWMLTILPSSDNSCALTSTHFWPMENNRTQLDAVMGILLAVVCQNSKQRFTVIQEDKPYIDGSRTPLVWQLDIDGCNVSWKTVISLSWAIQVVLTLKLHNSVVFNNPIEENLTNISLNISEFF